MIPPGRASADNEPTSTVLIDELGTLADHLNDDLAAELQSIVMCVQYSAFLKSLNRIDLSELFQTSILDGQRHAKTLAEMISYLGGTPTTSPRRGPQAVGAFQALISVFEGAARAVDDYTERVAEAALHGEHDLIVVLEQFRADAMRHRKDAGKILAGWTQA